MDAVEIQTMYYVVGDNKYYDLAIERKLNFMNEPSRKSMLVGGPSNEENGIRR